VTRGAQCELWRRCTREAAKCVPGFRACFLTGSITSRS
jgi:hypothetical protein